jgi:hypothetical protein
MVQTMSYYFNDDELEGMGDLFTALFICVFLWLFVVMIFISFNADSSHVSIVNSLFAFLCLFYLPTGYFVSARSKTIRPSSNPVTHLVNAFIFSFPSIPLVLSFFSGILPAKTYCYNAIVGVFILVAVIINRCIMRFWTQTGRAVATVLATIVLARPKIIVGDNKSVGGLEHLNLHSPW